MSSRVGQTEVNPILWTDFPVPITTMTGRRDSSGDRHVQTASTEPLIGIQVVLLIEHGISVHKRTLEVLTVDLDTFVNLEGDA